MERPGTIAWVAVVSALSCGVWGGGCASSPAPVVAPAVTGVEIPDVPRRPDGVVVEAPPAVPDATEHAPSTGVVTLREPLGGQAVVGVVRAMFHAFAREDRDALAALLTIDAVPLTGGRAARGALLDQWSARLRSLDYGLLGDADVARIDRMERYAYGELGVPEAPTRPVEMRPGDLLVRVPVTTPRIGAEPLFGDVVTLLLRREGDIFKIAGEAEE